jgi:hypothetical protein
MAKIKMVIQFCPQYSPTLIFTKTTQVSIKLLRQISLDLTSLEIIVAASALESCNLVMSIGMPKQNPYKVHLFLKTPIIKLHAAPQSRAQESLLVAVFSQMSLLLESTRDNRHPLSRRVGLEMVDYRGRKS